LLLASYGKRALEIGFCFRRVRLSRLERDFARNSINLGVTPPFLGSFRHGHRFANAAPGVIELAEFGIGTCQR
jgi:hypothetical protein